MKQVFVLALVVAALSPIAAKAEIVWNGGSAARYLVRKNNDGLSTVNVNGKNSSEATAKTYQLRADLNASEKGEQWDWGVGMRTSSGTTATSDWVTFGNGADLAFMLENAYARGHREVLGGEGSFTLGRAKTVIAYDMIAQGFLDKDNRWDGFGWTWKHGDFGLNAAQYLLGARNKGVVGATTYSATENDSNSANTQSGFGVLYSVQPTAKFKVSDSIDAMFAVGYHIWSGTGASNTAGFYNNAIHGGTAGTVGNVDPIIMDSARQWQFLTDWSLPMKFRFVGEFVQNKKVYYGTRLAQTDRKASGTMYALSLVYGQLKTTHDWTLSYSYVRKGAASVINTFTNANQLADNTGHLVDAKYLLAQGLSIGAKMELYREISKVGGDGASLVAPNQNRRQTQDRFEFVAGLAF